MIKFLKDFIKSNTSVSLYIRPPITNYCNSCNKFVVKTASQNKLIAEAIYGNKL